TVSSNPYNTSYTTGTLSTNTTYYVEATSGSLNTARKAVTVVVNAVPATPSVTPTQPTCSVATGTITITAPTGSGMTYSINGSTYTNTTGVFTSVASGTYNVTAKNSAGCISSATSTTINSQPSTPAKPTLTSQVQPTCAVPSGTITISNYNAAYTYAASPSTGVSFSGATVTAPSGTYTITATLGSCTSVASNSFTMNALATDTWSASGWSTGSPPTSSQRIVFAHNYSSSANLTGCSCLVSSGNVVINSGHTLSVTNDVKVTSGSLTFEDTASLVQTNDAAVNSGNITYKRKTAPLKQYDYTYWSSPVVGATLSQLATNSLLYSFNQFTSHWVFQTGATPMTQGVGYIGRAPSNLTYSPTQVVETSFVGVPANGTINTSIIKDTSTYSLIGNPYPSAIDVDLFITANTAVTNGTVYFWTHDTPITNYVYTVNDYAKYNLTGSTRTSTTSVGGSVFPTGKIAAGQGFFIEAKTSLANGTYTAHFNDAMRISGNNTQFFKTTSPTSVSNSISEGLERHRVWLSLSNPQGAYNQMLLGYVEGATNDFDSLFDGKTLPVGNPVTIYTIVGTDNLSIQAKSLPFSETDIVPIAYNTTINGELTITLDDYDGLFTTQNVYLLDKTNNTLHDLKAAPYTFVTTNGTFTDRFELRYTENALGTSNPTVTANDIKIITADNQLQVLSPAAAIEKIQVYDILGKLLFTQNDVNANLYKTDSLHIAPQILLVKVTLDDQSCFTKKVLME
ncbi:MAG TPA: T9SS sorting signal type C domain-containing protein, partial [Flavobacterium sp.]|uniref:T9SS sorting signal type C domain-containing protein n=1 Tax=Flavobacterium sp. TaxID=239 RepID=UPI002C1F0609